MTKLPQDDPIERLLRDDARRRLPDDGFSGRVERALLPARHSPRLLRPALVLASAAIGGALAWLLSPADSSLAQGFLDLARAQSLTPSAATALGTAIAMAVIAAVLVVEES